METSKPPVLHWILLAISVISGSRLVYKLAEARWKRKYINTPVTPKKEIRVWVDGVFDMMHFGHANMLRQAKALGDFLIVGVNSGESVLREKGTSPLMSDSEREDAVRGCKWADLVVPQVPYVMDAAYIKEITEKYKIDLFVHGDDPCFDSQGNDVYALVKAEGKFRTVKRTEGVSSTELVGRMLLMTKDHHHGGVEKLSPSRERGGDLSHAPSINTFGQTRVSQFLPTTRRLAQFSEGKSPKPGDKIVYVDGSWDMFHPGHIALLKAAKEVGDFLLVGICDDQTINAQKGKNWPIMNLHERTLNVLSCKWVDEVIIGAPWACTKDLITTMNISVVIHGSVHTWTGPEDPYKIPKEMGIFMEIPSPSTLTTEDIVERIVRQREGFEKRYSAKAAKEDKYLEEKKFVQEL